MGCHCHQALHLLSVWQPVDFNADLAVLHLRLALQLQDKVRLSVFVCLSQSYYMPVVRHAPYFPPQTEIKRAYTQLDTHAPCLLDETFVDRVVLAKNHQENSS